MTQKKKKFPLYLQILAGMILGIILGIIALQFKGGIPFIQHWIYPWGKLFIRLLQLIAVPLIIVSLVKGMIGLKDITAFSKMGGRAILFYFSTSILAVSLGLSMGLLVKPGKIVDKTKVEHIQQAYQTAAAEKGALAEQSREQGPLSFIEEIVPYNVFEAATNNSKMLQVIFFILFFGVAALAVKPEKIKPVVDLFDSLNDIILRMVDYIIRFAPIGVTALMAGIVADFKGDLSIFSALGVYALTIVVSLLLLMYFFYPLFIHFFTDVSVKKFLQSMYPVQLFAFTTSSSAATLPVTMDVVKNKLGVSEDIVSFIMPVGATINMDGTSCYQTIAVLFIAQVLGIDLSISQLLVIVGMSILSSIGTPAIPGGSFVILSIVLASVGIPAEGLALILGIDRPLDMLRTSVNVTGDSVIAAIIDKK
ncbi:glutamate:proton symporter [Bacteroidia bacterium]|nr:glutamate:proton symporter [Bacteroidia bacterium]GHT27095.1 glutamate:proton symporter [Bacteroidia bacterium]GHV71139.1 glutamate:proton symporter [Bacteroidia bacterium]